jgi:tetratricopeptide (TPR) repeat protein
VDRTTIGLIGTFGGVGIGLAGLAATMLWQARRREQNARAETGGVAVAGDQHVSGSLVTGAGAVGADRGSAALSITAHPHATVNVYLDGLPDERKPEIRDHFEEGRRLQDAEQCEAAIREFEEAFSATQNDSQRCALHILIGNSFGMLGKLEEGEGHYRQALILAQRVRDRKGQATALGNLGLIYRDRRDLERAEEYHKKALAIDQEIGDKFAEAIDLGNLGNVYGDLGELNKARHWHKQALHLASKTGSALGQSRALNNLGLIYTQKGQLAKARHHHRQALKIDSSIENQSGEVRDLLNVGRVYTCHGDLDNAEWCLLQALEIARSAGYGLSEALALGNLGLLALQRGDPTKGLEFLEASAAVYGRAGAVGQAAQSVRSLVDGLRAGEVYEWLPHPNPKLRRKIRSGKNP